MSGTIEKKCWRTIEKNDFRKVKLYLDRVKTDKILDTGVSILHFLSGKEGLEVTELLKECLEHGASPNVPSNEGITPVHVAAMWGLYENLCILMEYGGDAELRDNDGLSAVDHAYQSNESQANLCVKLLKSIILDDDDDYDDDDDDTPPRSDLLDNTLHTDHESSLKSSRSDKLYPADKLMQAALNLDDADKNQLYPCIKASISEDLISQDWNENDWCSIKSQGDDYTKIKSDIKFTSSNGCDEGYCCSSGNIDKKYESDNVDSKKKDCSNQQTCPQTLFQEYDSNVREFMTEDELSSESFANNDTTLTSFYTACDESLEDTEVSFPKLHPWTTTNDTIANFEDTIINGVDGLNMNGSNNGDPHNIANVSTLSDGTILYDWKDSILNTSSECADMSIQISDSMMKLSCEQVKAELLALGEDPGPVREDTRILYIRRLARLKSSQETCSSRLKEYLPEVRQIIEGKLPKVSMDPMDESMCVDFTKDSLRSKWREGTEKSSFNYLLLDPRVTQNLPSRSRNLDYEDIFHTFVASIFYVGKGKRARPYAHLHEAANKSKSNQKLNQIRDIWSAGLGVVSLHCFQGVIPVEAYTREACMVEALGLTRLTNIKRGEYYGRAQKWSVKKKRQMGVFLIKRALQIFLNEGERQIRPEDLRK